MAAAILGTIEWASGGNRTSELINTQTKRPGHFAPEPSNQRLSGLRIPQSFSDIEFYLA